MLVRHRAIIVADATQYLRDNPDKAKKYHDWSKRAAAIYGITPDEYRALTSRPCVICGEDAQRMVLDHDHANGKIRGGLCINCNSGLGMYRDDPELLVKAANYVDGFRKLHAAGIEMR